MTLIATPAGTAGTPFEGQYRAARAMRDPGASLAWRDAAFSAFAARGLPSRRVESWHYTDLRALWRDPLPPARAPGPEAMAAARRHLAHLVGDGALRLVVLDGIFVPELSDVAALAPRVRVSPLLEVLDRGALDPELTAALELGRDEAVVSLNAAFLQGGIVIDVEPGTKLDQPLELLMLAAGVTPGATYTRSFLKVGQHASATLVERHSRVGQLAAQADHVLVLAVEDGASLDHLARIEDLGAASLHVGTTLARLGADARLSSLTLTATQGITRRQAFLEFQGRSSQAQFRGLALLDGRSHADTTLVVTHTAPHCESRELYKHILDGEATGVFQGKVVVAPGAQKTDGKMLSNAILLAEGASMFNKPELEIFADDVVCGHGATAGSLDDDQLFYLRARGIPLPDARAMLLEAFAAQALEGVASEAIRADLTERVATWLRRHGG